jgi:type III secretion protein V
LTIRLAPNVSRQLTPEQMNVHFMRMRGELSAQLGMPFPGVQMYESAELERGVIEVHMFDVRRFSTTVPPRRVLMGFNRQVAAPPAPDPDLPSLAELDPDWRWMEPLPPDTPLPAGAFYVRFEALIARCVRLVVFRHAGTLVGMSEATTLLRAAENEYPELVAEVQKVLTLNKIADVLRRLLDEMMPVRDMRNILETLSIAATREKDPVMLTEQVRIAMTSQTCQRFSPGGGIVYVVVLSEDAEAAVRSALQESRGNYLPFTVDESKRLISSCRKAAENSQQRELVLAVHVEIRRYLRKIVEPQARDLWVVSFGELADANEVVVLGEADFRE